jgi:hypothetical protein
LTDYNWKKIEKKESMMKKRGLFLGAMLAAASVWAGSLPGKPAASSYIGKRWMMFELNNGPSYKWKKLPDGSSIQYWRSDIAGCCVGRYDSGQGNRCDLVIRLDAKKVIRQINIVEDGIACGYALR